MACTRSTRFMSLAVAACMVAASAFSATYRVVKRAIATLARQVVHVVAAKPVGFTWTHKAIGLVPRVLRMGHYVHRQERGELALPRLGLAT